MAGSWLGLHLSHRPAEGPGLDPVKTGTVLTVEIEAAKPPDAQAQNCYNVILDTSYWPQYVTRPAQTQRHGHSAPTTDEKSLKVTFQSGRHRLDCAIFTNICQTLSNNLRSRINKVRPVLDLRTWAEGSKLRLGRKERAEGSRETYHRM